ncbi:hypothetical protein DRN69_01365 [Candidatus Pacearchaeota archaeon]|nr:MAG: hypothetical protein DRN69_01365 [Candidatus Pacearchaeota archaeon]
MEKFLEYLQKSEKIIKTIDHMTYVTFPLIKDKKILLKILLETKTAITNCINSVLQYEYLYKRIDLYKNPKTNLRTFVEKCASRYRITQKEISLILELFEIEEKHKQSSMEFFKDGKIVILSENMKTDAIKIEKIKEFLDTAKSVLMKIKKKF